MTISWISHIVFCSRLFHIKIPGALFSTPSQTLCSCAQIENTKLCNTYVHILSFNSMHFRLFRWPFWCFFHNGWLHEWFRAAAIILWFLSFIFLAFIHAFSTSIRLVPDENCNAFGWRRGRAHLRRSIQMSFSAI